jgi:integrase
MSDRRLRALPLPEKKSTVYVDADTPGLVLEVYPSGKKTWRFRFSLGGRGGEQGKVTLGTFPATSLSVARVRARENRALVEAGINPQRQKKINQHAPTLEALINQYFASRKYAQFSKSHQKALYYAFKRDIIPALGKHKAKDVQRRDVRQVIEKIIKRGCGGQANHTLTLLKALYSWAISNDLVAHNPATHISTDIQRVARDRVLSREEIYSFWVGLERIDVLITIKLILKFQLVTAQRIGEILSMRWADITDNVWTIPSQVTKNRQRHLVPLSPLAQRLLVQTAETALPSRFVFPSPLPHVDKPIGYGTVSRNLLHQVLPALELAHFTTHDLRRTAATMMAASGAERDNIKRILNHVDSSVTAIYDRYSYLNEKRHYLEKWALMLEEIIAG